MIESEKFMRLDKFLCENNIGTRSQVKDAIRKGMVTINGTVAQKPEEKIEETKDIIAFQGQELRYQKYVYYMLNKPEGVVSATNDNTAPTVLELLPAQGRKDLFPVGRLDKDTTGLLLLTNDGALAHDLLSPKKHVDKTYLVQPDHPLSEEDIHRNQVCALERVSFGPLTLDPSLPRGAHRALTEEEICALANTQTQKK